VTDRNVAALARILNSNALYRYKAGLDSLENLADYLSSRGVRAPDAYDLEQINRRIKP
jgi:undecaprenyl pyrophosphate synthase